MTEKPAPTFMPIVAKGGSTAARVAPAAPVIEMQLAGAVVRVVGGQDDGAQLTAVLRAVQASASRS